MKKRAKRQRFYASLRADRLFISMLVTDHFYEGPEDEEPELLIYVPRQHQHRAT